MYGGSSFQNSCMLSYDLIIQEDEFTALGVVGIPKAMYYFSTPKFYDKIFHLP